MLRSHGVRVLRRRDTRELAELCDRDPVANVFVAGRLEQAGSADARAMAGETWGYFEHGRLVSACWAGANLVPVEVVPAAVVPLAGHARDAGRGCSSIVGPAAAVLALWREVRSAWGPAREVRPDQPLMVLDRDPAVTPDPLVRRVRPDEVDVLFPASVAMFTEEVGYSPVAEDGGARYRARVRYLVEAGYSFARIERGPSGPRVVFKAEIGAVSARATQIQGVWVDPARRGRGLSEPGVAAVAAAARADVAPVVSLYVNGFNDRAIAAYDAVGFRRAGTFATVLF